MKSIMKTLLVLFVAALAGASVATKRQFPTGFKFGASSAAYQVEGAWNEDGKSEGIWDRLLHTTPSFIKDSSNADVAIDSYHNIDRDVELLRELGLDFYRFSIAWPRILPTGFPNIINEAGVAYYNKLIDTMLKYNIEPMVTIYHWDLPQSLQDLGGWTSEEIVNWFGDYSRVVYGLFGDRVKTWVTINEPRVMCYGAYSEVSKAPALNSTGYGDYLCARNLLLAHAESYHIYDKEFRSTQGGKVGIVMDSKWVEPDNENEAEAADKAYQFADGLYAHPIFSKKGNYPQVVIDAVAAKSAEQGFFRSRLPALTQQQIEYIRGTADFMGINHYTTSLAYTQNTTSAVVPGTDDDRGVTLYQKSEWVKSKSAWIKYVPWGFKKVLLKIKEEYDNPLIYVTENGFGLTEGLDDEVKINFFKDYLDSMLDAIDEGCNVQAYSIWSLTDNFSWIFGYTSKFGLYEVDLTSANKTRTPRRSAFFYKDLIKNRALDKSYVAPYDGVMTIDDDDFNLIEAIKHPSESISKLTSFFKKIIF